jgi:hypothetical protein
MDLGLDRHYKDFAPRLGVAYRLNEKTVIRTGFGISYAPFPDNTYAYNFPVKQNNAYEPNCSICPAAFPNGQIASFQAGFPPATPAAIPSNGIIANPDPSQVYFVVNPHFREPYVESWNFAIQRSLPSNFVLDVAYVGNHGVDQPANYNLNASTTIGADVQGQPEYLTFGRKANTELRYVGYSSMYNGLQLKLDKRFSGGLALTTAYTFSKAMGYQSEDSFLEFFINPGRNWQRLNFDRKHFFVQSYVYELPFGRGKQHLQSGPASWILGGWQVNGILTIASGAPLGNNGGTVAFSTSAAGLKAPGNQNTLNHYGPIHVSYGDGFDHPWFDNTKCTASITTNCFSQPAPLQFGNLGPNVIDGPGYWNLDASLFRNFRIRERWNLQFRGEAFSVMNTPQWGQPNTDYTSPNFGYITGLANMLPGGWGGGARQFQLGAKLTF